MEELIFPLMIDNFLVIDKMRRHGSDRQISVTFRLVLIVAPQQEIPFKRSNFYCPTTLILLDDEISLGQEFLAKRLYKITK